MTRTLIGADHAGFTLKGQLMEANPQYNWLDLGTFSSESIDYPDIAKLLTAQLAPAQFGVLICGSGIGMSIMANRYSHVRAANCLDPEMASLARSHNDANVLCLGARRLSVATASEILCVFHETQFAAGRHQPRVNSLGGV